MKVAGIIVEYNPLHLGHIYHIQKTREITNCDVLIAVMSGSFTQRGDPAVVDKWTRVKEALNQGVDIVIELPFVHACQSADFFAKGAITLLSSIGVDSIVFGSESNDPEQFIETARILSKNPKEYQERVHNYMEQGLSYPTSCNKALEDLNLNSIITPNDLLGFSYIKEIVHQNLDIRIHTISRNGSFHEKTLNAYSASSIRLALKNHQSIKEMTPMDEVLMNTNIFFLDDYYPLLKYNVLMRSKEELKNIHLMDEGMENLFKKNIQEHNTMESFLQSMTSKRYTRARIQRTIIHLLMNNTRLDISQANSFDYLRVLGMNQKGQNYLSSYKKESPLPIITNYQNNFSKCLDLEFKAAQLLSLLLPLEKQKDFMDKEKRSIPIIKK